MGGALVDHAALPSAGYTVPWSVPAGGRVTLHLSASDPVESVRLRRLDLPIPATLDWPIERLGAAGHRSIEQGSFLLVEAAELAKAGAVEAVRFELFLTRNEGARTILHAGGLALMLENGALRLARAGGDAGEALEGPTVPAGVWLDVALTQHGQDVRVALRACDPFSGFAFETALPDCALTGSSDGVLFGADPARRRPTLNARFARIAIAGADFRHEWRFPTILPDGPLPSGAAAPLHLRAVNLPTFCVRSARWDGSSFDPRLVPDQYDAVHCHDDDMGPLDWPACFAATIPTPCESGIYAFEAVSAAGRESFVFFVPASTPAAPLVFLAPTATYLAYADEALPPHLYEWKGDDRGHRFAAANGLRSLYDYHNDHSGVSICSWRRPKATLREDYRYPLCGCPHNLPVDLRLLRFCRAQGIAFDLITDHDLHERGAAALRGYKGLVTGSHPEYMSVEMEGAIRAFAAEGGGIAYLGGNGFAAVAAFRDDLMEVRRSPLEAGRTWDGPVAEQALALTNEPGGFLRSRGRGEFSLVGVGISLMGFEEGRPFRRTERSREADVAWVFEGVAADVFGAEGTVLGAAAGYEVDATDPHLGTPPDTIVLARATDFPESFFHDPSRWYEGGAPEAASRRCAEMTLRQPPAGGLIFAASSVAWCGALPAPEAAVNDVGRITLNVLRRLAGGEARPDDRPDP